MHIDDRTEWLEADGLGGFASGTTSGVRTRRYHAPLLSATTPPTGRMALVNGVDAFIETKSGAFALSSQRYASGVVHPDGSSRIVAFQRDPWPTWEFETSDGVRIRQEIVAPYDSASTIPDLGGRALGCSGGTSCKAVPVRSRLPLAAP
jgi:glycogen debranching enzyme